MSVCILLADSWIDVFYISSSVYYEQDTTKSKSRVLGAMGLALTGISMSDRDINKCVNDVKESKYENFTYGNIVILTEHSICKREWILNSMKITKKWTVRRRNHKILTCMILVISTLTDSRSRIEEISRRNCILYRNLKILAYGQKYWKTTMSLRSIQKTLQRLECPQSFE